jgi:hypothetical protein
MNLDYMQDVKKTKARSRIQRPINSPNRQQALGKT